MEVPLAAGTLLFRSGASTTVVRAAAPFVSFFRSLKRSCVMHSCVRHSVESVPGSAALLGKRRHRGRTAFMAGSGLRKYHPRRTGSHAQPGCHCDGRSAHALCRRADDVTFRANFQCLDMLCDAMLVVTTSDFQPSDQLGRRLHKDRRNHGSRLPQSSGHVRASFFVRRFATNARFQLMGTMSNQASGLFPRLQSGHPLRPGHSRL